MQRKLSKLEERQLKDDARTEFQENIFFGLVLMLITAAVVEWISQQFGIGGFL